MSYLLTIQVKFLNELKKMLVNKNTSMLSLLTMLINKFVLHIVLHINEKGLNEIR